MNESTRYPHVVRYLSETPWAILPSALVKMREIVALKLAGGVLTREEIEARIGNQREKTPSQGAIAVIPVHGVIIPHADLMSDISGGTSIDGFLEVFREAVADSAIATIVLDIDSPGGSVELLSEAAAEIRAARASKDVIAVANATAASAAYYLMAQATEAVVTPSGSVGSIGTIAIHQDISKALEMEGIDPTIVTFGEFKGEGHPFEPLEEDARAELQRLVDSYGQEFVADVAKGRGVSVSTVANTFGQGRMLRAEDALGVGMVDRIASLDDVIAKLVGGRKTTTRTRAEAPGLQLAAADTINSAVAGAPAVAAGLVAAGARLGAITGAVAGAAPTDRKEVSTMETTEKPRSREEQVARIGAIEAEMAELDAKYTGELMEGEDLEAYEALKAEKHRLSQIIRQGDARRIDIESAFNAGSTDTGDGAAPSRHAAPASNVDTRRNLPGDLFDVASYRSHASSLDDLERLWKEGARHVNESLVFECEEQDPVKARVEKIISREQSKGRPADSFAHRVLLTSNPEYDRAFGKYVMYGADALSSTERAMISAAVSHTGLGAETPVPVTIDPSVLLTSDGATNPLRQIADVRTITGLKWRGINSEGVTVEYAAELTAVDPVTPDFDAPEADVVKAQAEIQMSIEVDEDWPSLRSELSTMLADAKDTKEAQKFLLGTGTNEPEGLIWALEDDGTSIEETETLNTFDLEDLIAFKGTLPPRFRGNASYLANDSVFDAIRLFGVDEVGPNAFWVDLNDGNPPRLLGKPAYEASYMESDPTDGGEVILVYGDFRKGFLIIDRVGMNVINAGLVRNGDGKLTGAVAIYAYWRNTSKLRTPNAFRALAVQNS